MTAMIKAIRGMKDILPPETDRWQRVESAARETFALYGYREMRLPLLERTELFARSIGAETDIVAKEMYTFPDRRGDSLTLRPEATASVLRAVLENGLHLGAGVKKFYLIGPMFRYERPQKGRYRQFNQVSCEALGSDAPELDAEVIFLAMDVLKGLGLTKVRLLINSLGCRECQARFKESLKGYLAMRSGWCEDCDRRRQANPLRVFDCKSANCQELLVKAPMMRDWLCEDCLTHYRRVKELLERFQVDYEEQPRLVRGLDYYTRTAFEVVAQEGLGSQDAVLGGGRYNGLARDLGGPDLPGIGFAIGEERLVEVLAGEAPPKTPFLVFIAALGPAARDRAIELLRELRGRGVAAEMDFEDRSLKAQMSLADRLGAAYVTIIGDKELGRGEALVRPMRDISYKRVEKGDLTETKSGKLVADQQSVSFEKLMEFMASEQVKFYQNPP